MSEVTTAGPTAGDLLRQARERAGLHVAALAVSLKVPVRKLEALESGQYELLPDAVFARGLASSVCRTLKIDPQPVLERLPQSGAPRLAQYRDSINAPFRQPGELAGAGWSGQLRRPVPLAVGALLLGALLIVLVPNVRLPGGDIAAAEGGAPMAQPVVIQGAPLGAADAGAATDGAPVPAASVASSVDPVSTPVPAAPAPVVAAVVMPASVAPAPAIPSTAAAPGGAVGAAAPAAPLTPGAAAPVADPATGTVVFRASAPSWVQVTDAQGVVSLRRLLNAGESAGASGALPLAVTVGSASATSVEVRGKAFDLAPVSRDNVARFEVK